MPLIVKSRPQGIFFSAAESNTIGMAAVAVVQIGAEGGYLDLTRPGRTENGDHPEGGANGKRPLAAETRPRTSSGMAEVATS